jgi:hypothetical protein
MQLRIRYIVGVILIPVTIFVQFSNIFKGQLMNRALGSYRSLFWFGGAMMIWALLEFITMLTNKRRRAIHDFIAGTVVIKEPLSKRNWVLWICVCLFLLNLVVPHFIHEANMVVGAR